MTQPVVDYPIPPNPNPNCKGETQPAAAPDTANQFREISSKADIIASPAIAVSILYDQSGLPAQQRVNVAADIVAAIEIVASSLSQCAETQADAQERRAA